MSLLYSPTVGTRSRGFYRIFALCLLLNVLLIGTVAFAAASGVLLAWKALGA